MDAVHQLLSVEQHAEWDAALAGIRYGFAHTRDYCDAIARSSGAPVRLYSYVRGEDRFVCPITERRFHGQADVVTPIGFSGFVGQGDFERFLRHWHEYARASGWVCGYIGLNPIVAPEAIRAGGDYFAHNEIFVLNLARSEAELADRLSTNRKRQLRRFRDEGHVVTDDGDLVRSFLVEHLEEFLRDRGANEDYRISEATIHRLFASDRTLALAVAPGDMVEAAVLFGYTLDCGDYLFGASKGEGKRHSAALIWHGAMLLRRMGVARLNLGGGIRKADGVAEFKTRFGADVLELGSLKQVYRPDAYAELCLQVGADSSDRGGFFPAYRAPAGRSAAAHLENTDDVR